MGLGARSSLFRVDVVDQQGGIALSIVGMLLGALIGLALDGGVFGSAALGCLGAALGDMVDGMESTG